MIGETRGLAGAGAEAQGFAGLGGWVGALVALGALGLAGSFELPELALPTAAAAMLAREWLVGGLLAVSALGPAAAVGGAVWAVAAGVYALARRRRRQDRWRAVERLERTLYLKRRKRRPRS